MKRRLLPVVVGSIVLVLALGVSGAAGTGGELDPARNVALPCEVLLSVPQVPRSVRNMTYVANKCGFVGTDIEFQSRPDSTGKIHDYAFVGSMGGGPRIFDVTNPANPTPAGGYADPGWENDIQVRGDVMVNTFDGVDDEPSSGSACLQIAAPGSAAGVDILKLNFNPVSATFTTNLITCVPNPPGGAHNASLAPSGEFLAISNCCSDFAVDIIDLRGLGQNTATFMWRLIDSGHMSNTTCPPALVTWKCVVMKKPDGTDSAGTWRPHDVFFSADSRTMYVAAINSTWIVSFDMANAVNPVQSTLAVIPNNLNDPIASHNISISHQADTTSDGKILIISDERGGGLTETGCNRDADGVLGGLHLFALAPIAGAPQTAGASPTNPIKLGDYFTPPPLMATDPLSSPLSALRIERGCTIHVFRFGGNGSTSPGEIFPGLGGVSSLPVRQTTAAHYGAGSWWIDISGPSSNSDGQVEDARSTWGNTLGWIVMPGADTWSAKEYKGHVYTGDMVRGMDVLKLVGGTTAVTLVSFKASRTTRGVRVTWRTATETQAVGFNLYRAGVEVNRALIRAHGGLRPASYSFVDRAGKRGTTYRLQVVGPGGRRSWAGSVVVR